MKTTNTRHTRSDNIRLLLLSAAIGAFLGVIVVWVLATYAPTLLWR